MRTTYLSKQIVGVKRFQDLDTGEIIEMPEMEVEQKDFNFHKVWLQNLIFAFEDITNAKLKFTFWLIENIDYENRITLSQEEMANLSKTSVKTVSRTLTALTKNNFLTKERSNVYQVNPSIIYKGKHSNRMGVCYKYRTRK